MSTKFPVVIKRVLKADSDSLPTEPLTPVRDPQTQDLARKQILEIINFALKKLVSQPEKTEAEIQIGERTTLFVINTIQTDFGRILGSGGKTIGSLRTLVTAMAANQGIRAVVQIANEESYFLNKNHGK
ncbi:KH domain-containing protein [Bdellovibrio bacteriovorus]|uniref:KH domain-containing protein n=1 Tax=Bdellovibrio TaxID=958 RepID=UPI0035A9736E